MPRHRWMMYWDPIKSSICRRPYRQHGFIFPALYYAAFAGLEEVCDWLLKKGADPTVGPDGRDWQLPRPQVHPGCTLHAAVLGNVERLVVLLIQNYPGMIEATDERLQTPLELAIILGNKGLVHKFVEFGANVKNLQILANAAATGRIDLVEFLIKNGADTREERASAIVQAAISGFGHMTDHLIQTSRNVTEMAKLGLEIARRFGFDSLAGLIRNAPGRGELRAKWRLYQITEKWDFDSETPFSYSVD